MLLAVGAALAFVLCLPQRVPLSLRPSLRSLWAKQGAETNGRRKYESHRRSQARRGSVNGFASGANDSDDTDFSEDDDDDPHFMLPASQLEGEIEMDRRSFGSLWPERPSSSPTRCPMSRSTDSMLSSRVFKVGTSQSHQTDAADTY